ncbi:hypothetical protein [Agrobacterium pusense]|uniref:hypothetical protein n=1 Tax=Agrobacterium pusense TaxID=648995 RepID=UPI00244767D8|nr:hypothetical protein [Agrobacterium pusense]MDH0869715.1 hypothetical protein [Agrobacterium pusense]
MADSKIDDGGSAFPVPEENRLSDGTYCNEGMSLRDYFAGQALAGIYASRDLQHAILHDQGKAGSGEFDTCMAKQAYSQADAMIAARKAGA